MQLFTSLLLIFILIVLLGMIIGLLAGFQDNHQFFEILFWSSIFLIPLYFLSRTKLYSGIVVLMIAFLFAYPLYAIVVREDFSEDRIRSVLGWLIIVYLLGISLFSFWVNVGLVGLSLLVVLLLPVFVPVLELRTVVPGLGFLLTAALFILANVRYRVVTETDRAASIHEMQDTYRAVVENSLQGLAVFQNGRIVFANSAYANILGYSVEELFALQPDQLRELIHPDDLAILDRRAHPETGEAAPASLVAFRIHRKDGRVRWVESNATGIFYRGSLSLLSAAVDITERKRSELAQTAIYNIAEAAQTTLDLDEFYKAVHKIICELMPAKNIYITLYDPVNDLFRVAYRQDEFDKEDEWLSYKPGKGLGAYILRTGKPVLITPETFEEMNKAGEVEIIAHNMVDYLGVPLKTPKGVIGVMAIQTYTADERLTESDRNVLAIISSHVATAIERKQAQLEREHFVRDLEAKNAELERFTYTVSHDLRSPLITIRGFLGYIEKAAQSGDMEQLRGDMQRIINATNKMENLLNDLLELSRIGRIANPSRLVPFNEIVNEALTNVGGHIEQSRASVDVQVGMPMVYGDMARLVEVMQNLLENAIKFSGDHPPQIEIGFRHKDEQDRNVFFVRDHGIGIAPQYHERIFGLFNKLNAHSEGTGIGLALVKRIVEVHDGQIWVESEGPGSGATFLLALPNRST